MELFRLEYFLKIVETGGFTTAADGLFVSQSCLSKQMQKLEKDLGCSLFVRGQRGLLLTSAGETLRRRAPELLALYQTLLAELSPEEGCLRVAAFPVMAQYGLTGWLTAFARDCPAVKLSICETENAEIPAGLDARRFDLAFLREADPDTQRYEILPICQDELALVVPENHALAGRKQVSLGEFAQENFILLDGGTQLRESSLRACARAGFSPRVVYTGSESESIAGMVRGQAGVAIFMRRVAEFHKGKGLAVLPFIETETSVVCLARLRKYPLCGAGNLFWQYFRERLQ